jgi:hypothetical protein
MRVDHRRFDVRVAQVLLDLLTAMQTSLEHAGGILLALVGGTIVGLVYFSDLRTNFRKLGDAREASGAA